MEKAFTQRVEGLFQSVVEIPRIRVGKRQTFETLINEEALLLAKYLRNEKKDWEPRIVGISNF
jgi:hypothetical protein